MTGILRKQLRTNNMMIAAALLMVANTQPAKSSPVDNEEILTNVWTQQNLEAFAANWNTPTDNIIEYEEFTPPPKLYNELFAYLNTHTDDTLENVKFTSTPKIDDYNAFVSNLDNTLDYHTLTSEGFIQRPELYNEIFSNLDTSINYEELLSTTTPDDQEVFSKLGDTLEFEEFFPNLDPTLEFEEFFPKRTRPEEFFPRGNWLDTYEELLRMENRLETAKNSSRWETRHLPSNTKSSTRWKDGTRGRWRT